MLKLAALVLVGLVAAILGIVACLYLRAVLRGRRTYKALASRIAPVADALAKGEEPSDALLVRYAENRETRKVLFDVLESANKIELFPQAFLTWELMAEADLVAWLCHPNELGGPPSEIELVAQVPAPSRTSDDLEYFVFRYRMHEPHWAAKDGWLAGVAGPYATNERPASSGRGTFSRFEAIDRRPPQEHVALVHKAIFGEA